MPDDHDLDRSNDVKLLTPLLFMALVIVCAFLVYGWLGHPLLASG